mmetsp:Transcript_11449/g.27875  ORF Transcript_11449/g.27875 Transcript_11449/m.27875 type:complete len:149 (-) Transcript_11449:133-579(-)
MSGPPPSWQQQQGQGQQGMQTRSSSVQHHQNAPPEINGYAAMARDALNEHMPALLGRGGLALRARARLAAARAALATTPTVAALAADPTAVLAPLEAAAECCAAAGSFAAEADAHYLRAVTLNALGGRVPERNAAAREFRRCTVAASV